MNYKQLSQNRIKKAHFNRIKRLEEKYSDRIKFLKSIIKKDKVYLDKCKEYDREPSFIDDVNVYFSPIDVSAKTVNGEIFLNENLFNEPIEKQLRYLGGHEIIHVMQQEAGKVNGKVDKEDYLDDPNEQEAFKTQLKFQCEHESAEEIQDYIENLLDHHDIRGKEREEKAKILVEDL
ncbi:MAG: hypothetical protein WC516_08295 [Patescibacteria group bacterium]